MASKHALGTLVRKPRQNRRWSEARSWMHMVEEHDFNPVVRGRRAIRKTGWRWIGGNKTG
jgi:hypothetical protein